MGQKRRLGDRKDAKLLRNIDAMHFIMPIIYPNRCDNEAFVSERIDLTALSEYLEKKNSTNPEYEYKLFQAIVTAILKVITLRPKMNRFIANNNLYERNDITASFIIKKTFSDTSEEGMAFIYAKPTDTIEEIRSEMYRQISGCKNDTIKDSTADAMDILNKLPRWISKSAIKLMTVLDRHGKLPQSLIASDPYYASVILSNLGSIKLHSGYHHLTNWGTTSLFMVVGERKKRPFYDEDGNITMRDSVDLGLTVDERIADGYYFSNTIKLFKKILETPEILDKPLSLEVE